jgi:hypothetical protein
MRLQDTYLLGLHVDQLVKCQGDGDLCHPSGAFCGMHMQADGRDEDLLGAVHARMKPGKTEE